MFLGALDPVSGKVLIPSYHRPYLMIDNTLGPPREDLPDNPCGSDWRSVRSQGAAQHPRNADEPLDQRLGPIARAYAATRG